MKLLEHAKIPKLSSKKDFVVNGEMPDKVKRKPQKTGSKFSSDTNAEARLVRRSAASSKRVFSRENDVGEEKRKALQVEQLSEPDIKVEPLVKLKKFLKRPIDQANTKPVPDLISKKGRLSLKTIEQTNIEIQAQQNRAGIKIVPSTKKASVKRSTTNIESTEVANKKFCTEMTESDKEN